jgi:peptide/nickel transport system substrate-binding protein
MMNRQRGGEAASGNRKRRLGLSLGLGLFTAVALANDGVVDIAAPFEITSIDPSSAGYIFTRMEVAETLVAADEQGRPQPGLAHAWEVAGDGTEWRFTLQEGAEFHDGTPLTAEHAVQSLRYALAKPGTLEEAPITAIETDGDGVVIRLSEPFSPLLATLAHSSTQILAPAAYTERGEVVQVIGTGPYRVETASPPQRLVVARFADYWGEAPAVERASYLAAGRGETRALLAESGDADLVFTLDPASYARLERSERLELRTVPVPRTVIVKVNAEHPFLDDPRAREALSLALDRPGIAAAILRHPEAAATQLFPPSLAEWHVSELPALGRDLERARALLSELGWEAGANGVLERGGEPFRLTLRTFPDRPELPLIATAIQEQLRELGVEVAVSIGNSSEIPAGHQDGTLELALLSRNFALIPDPLGTLVGDYSGGGGDWGAMNWPHPELTETLAALLQSPEPDPAARERVTTILHSELPVIPVAWYQHTAAVARDLENVTIDPFERTYGVSRMRWSEPE